MRMCWHACMHMLKYTQNRNQTVRECTGSLPLLLIALHTNLCTVHPVINPLYICCTTPTHMRRFIGISLLLFIATHTKLWTVPSAIVPLYICRTSIMNAQCEWMVLEGA